MVCHLWLSCYRECYDITQVHHSERWSVISDCLVTGSVMTSHRCIIASEGLSSLIALLQEVLWHHRCIIVSEGLSSLIVLLQGVLWHHRCIIVSEGLSSLIVLLQEVLWRHRCIIASDGLSSLIALFAMKLSMEVRTYVSVLLSQTCAPHENAFSILRINFRILQSHSVVFF